MDSGTFLQALDALRRAIRAEQPVIIDFTEVHRISVEAMVLLIAEVERLVRVAPRVALRSVAPRSNRVREVFQQMGFGNLLGMSLSVIPIRDDVVHWVAAAGEQLEAAGEQLDAPTLAEQVERAAGTVQSTITAHVFRGICEAVANCAEHAYIADRGDGVRHHPDRKWWMLAQLREHRLTVCVCDLGIGIPRTLPLRHDAGILKSLFAQFQNLLHRSNADARSIRAAFEVGQSRTGATHRGKGLNDTLAVLRDQGCGDLTVASNRGLCSRSLASDGHWTENVSALPQSILGTIICWSLPLQTDR